ncbi:hypothetical protein JOQ06_018174 [Pogonophryne albipinna]|uniref:Sperm-associated antigen 6 n=1 Tax=Pogonophryne albipinna TaxID=1090488 RepID=A0AAD6AHW1_9TELE|nr:hypothetical protein JOQ06_018174 [Pogonophryne albipinna]
MSQRQIIQVFEQYQKSRMQFVQTVADLAARPQNIEMLQNAGVMTLLRPLMLDSVPGIQQTAALALGRLADHSDSLAEAVVREDILPQLVLSLASQNVRAELQEQIRTAPAVCLTTDCWTSNTTTSYMSVTCHYITDFKLRSNLLDCFVVAESHTSQNLAQELSRVAKEWGIQDKIAACVTDNASNIVKAVNDILKWNHVRCFAHLLNLTVRSSVHQTEIQALILKVKSIAEYVRRSTVASAKLREMQLQMGQVQLRMKQDVATRWNSTYFMMQRAIEIKEPLVSTMALLNPLLPALTPEEWDITKEVCDILKPFEEVTVEMSSERFVTGSKAILMARGLQRIVAHRQRNPSTHEPVKGMVNFLAADLEKRFGQIERVRVLAEATLLDPRFKKHAFVIERNAEETVSRVVGAATHARFYKKAAAFVLRAVAKHTPELAQAVLACGGVDALVLCLEEFDPGVKEAAAWALNYICRHDAQLSQSVVDAGAVPLLVLCLLEPEMALKRIAASTLSDISKHSPELAQTVVDNGAIAHLAQMILSPDSKLKRQVFSALSQISKHSVSLAEMVIEAEVFPAAVACLKDPDEYVRKNVTTLMREVVKHTPELSQVIVNCGGMATVIDFLGESSGNLRLPGIMMLGYVAAHSENLAMAVILSKGVPQLALCMSEEHEHHIKAAIAWSIGQIGHHSPEHAKAVATSNLLSKLLELYMEASSSEDLQAKSKKALKSILQKCTYLPGLEPLLYDVPSNILKHVVCQFSKVLPHDSKARRLFVTSGGLKKLQEIEAEPGSPLQDHINNINSCFPEEIVRYYSPGYSEVLLERLERYQPA